MEWIIQLPILFFSIMFHEVSHGFVALRNGDDTAQREGRLNFNPISHIDPVGTLILPAVCLLTGIPMIGWAKPVPVNPYLLGNDRWALVRVALVGPASNLALALFCALAFKLTASLPRVLPGLQATALGALLFGVVCNLFLAFFNLIPIHPLDGSKVLSGVLPLEHRIRYERHAPYGFMIILAMVFLGLLGPLVSRPSNLVLGLFSRLGLLW